MATKKKTKRKSKALASKQRADIMDSIEAAQYLGHMARDDEWNNVVSGLGRVASDKRVSGEPGIPRNANDRARWENIFHGDPLAARIASLLPEDETREWIQVIIEDDKKESEGESEGEGDERKEDPSTDIEERVEVQKAVMDRLEELKIQQSIFAARTWARTYGGSLMLLGAIDGSTDLSKELKPEGITSFEHVNVFDRFEWTPHSWYNDPAKANFGLPETYIMGERNVPGGARSAVEIDSSTAVHESRFIRFDGPLTSRRRSVMNNGWHDPIFVKLYPILRDFAQAWGGVAAMLQDFRVAVWKMKGLADALAAGDHEAVIDRFRIMNLCVSISQAVPLDADNEEYEKKSTQLTGLPDTLDRFAEQVSAATGYPITLLFGKSAAGLSATGENDIRQYYDKVAASQRTHLRGPLTRIIELIFLDPNGPTSGKIPAKWSLKFNPLWQLDDLQEAQRRETMAKGDKAMIDAGVYTAEEIALSRSGGDEYSIETVLDLEARKKAAEEEEANGGVDKEREELRFQAEMMAAAAVNNGVPPEAPVDKEDNFRRRGPRDYVVTSNEGEIIGRHSTRGGAESQIGHILESQGVIVERLSASEWIVVNAEGDIVGVHTTRSGAGSQVNEILGRSDAAEDPVMHREKVAYYAHPMGSYGSDQEAEDIGVIEERGYTVVNPATMPESDGMETYLEAVRGSDIVFKRGETSGVVYEVHEAHKHGIPVTEL